MANYTMTVTFSSDRELTQEEIYALESTVWGQIIEPMAEANDEGLGLVAADYTTESIMFSTKLDAE